MAQGQGLDRVSQGMLAARSEPEARVSVAVERTQALVQVPARALATAENEEEEEVVVVVAVVEAAAAAVGAAPTRLSRVKQQQPYSFWAACPC
jgi:hypothetical protein